MQSYTYSVMVPDDGTITFDWGYDYHHGGWDIEAELFVDSSSGTDTFDADTCDCAGVWYGTSTVDPCGVCDADPGNDCVVDCEGTPGGSAYEDMCAVCDDNVYNDCLQDCNGVWGGAAVIDACGDCVGGTTGLTPCRGDSGDTGITDPYGDADTDADTDSDSDADADTDADADAGTDADADANTNGTLGTSGVPVGATATDGCGCAAPPTA